jgi:hypothetical protein
MIILWFRGAREYVDTKWKSTSPRDIPVSTVTTKASFEVQPRKGSDFNSIPNSNSMEIALTTAAIQVEKVGHSTSTGIDPKTTFRSLTLYVGLEEKPDYPLVELRLTAMSFAHLIELLRKHFLITYPFTIHRHDISTSLDFEVTSLSSLSSGDAILLCQVRNGDDFVHDIATAMYESVSLYGFYASVGDDGYSLRMSADDVCNHF